VTRPRAADDFVTIRARMEELRREREGTPAVEPDLPRDPRMQRAQNPRWLLSDIGAASGRVRQSGSGRPRDLEIPFCSACRDGEERSPVRRL
jgi:hypothetical protein